MLTRKKLLLLVGGLAVFYLLSYGAKPGTAAWFVSETTANGSIVNAKTADLVDVASSVVSCSDDGIAKVEVTITNKHVSEIPVRLGDIQKDIAPGKTVSVQISKQVSKHTTTIDVPFTGFNHFIDESIEIPLGQKCMETLTGSKSEVLSHDDEADVMREDAKEPDEAETSQKEEEVKPVETESPKAGAGKGGQGDTEVQKSERQVKAAEPVEGKEEQAKTGSQAEESESIQDASLEDNADADDSSAKSK